MAKPLAHAALLEIPSVLLFASPTRATPASVLATSRVEPLFPGLPSSLEASSRHSLKDSQEEDNYPHCARKDCSFSVLSHCQDITHSCSCTACNKTHRQLINTPRLQQHPHFQETRKSTRTGDLHQQIPRQCCSLPFYANSFVASVQLAVACITPPPSVSVTVAISFAIASSRLTAKTVSRPIACSHSNDATKEHAQLQTLPSANDCTISFPSELCSRSHETDGFLPANGSEGLSDHSSQWSEQTSTTDIWRTHH